MTKVAKFVKRTASMLAEHPDVVTWDESGTTIRIPDAQRFESILPIYFKTHSFGAFKQQARNYGFERNESGTEFHHPYFQRGRDDLHHLVKRTYVPIPRGPRRSSGVLQRVQSEGNLPAVETRMRRSSPPSPPEDRALTRSLASCATTVRHDEHVTSEIAALQRARDEAVAEVRRLRANDSMMSERLAELHARQEHMRSEVARKCRELNDTEALLCALVNQQTRFSPASTPEPPERTPPLSRTPDVSPRTSRFSFHGFDHVGATVDYPRTHGFNQSGASAVPSHGPSHSHGHGVPEYPRVVVDSFAPRGMVPGTLAQRRQLARGGGAGARCDSGFKRHHDPTPGEPGEVAEFVANGTDMDLVISPAAAGRTTPPIPARSSSSHCVCGSGPGVPCCCALPTKRAHHMEPPSHLTVPPHVHDDHVVPPGMGTPAGMGTSQSSMWSTETEGGSEFLWYSDTTDEEPPSGGAGHHEPHMAPLLEETALPTPAAPTAMTDDDTPPLVVGVSEPAFGVAVGDGVGVGVNEPVFGVAVGETEPVSLFADPDVKSPGAVWLTDACDRAVLESAATTVDDMVTEAENTAETRVLSPTDDYLA